SSLLYLSSVSSFSNRERLGAHHGVVVCAGFRGIGSAWWWGGPPHGGAHWGALPCGGRAHGGAHARVPFEPGQVEVEPVREPRHEVRREPGTTRRAGGWQGRVPRVSAAGPPAELGEQAGVH